MSTGMTDGCASHDHQAREQSFSNRYITAERGLRWLQTLRDCMTDGLPVCQGSARTRDDPVPGVGILGLEGLTNRQTQTSRALPNSLIQAPYSIWNFG